MSLKILQNSGTPITPEHTMEVNPDCSVIRLRGPACAGLPRQPGIRDLLLAVQSETESLLEQLEQHQEKSTLG